MAQRTETIDGVTSTGKPAPSELDNLDALAAQVDADTSGTLPDGTAIADQPPPINYAGEAAMTVDTIAALITGYCPATSDLWTDDKKQAVSAALAPVYEKYGFTLGGMPCELVLIITAGPLLYQSSKLIATQMAKEKQVIQAVTKATDAAKGKPAPDKPESPEILRHPQTGLYQ